ncbi:MAG: PEP-CTERM sorting domain-containing protein [Pseudomonadota bacterium]
MRLVWVFLVLIGIASGSGHASEDVWPSDKSRSVSSQDIHTPFAPSDPDAVEVRAQSLFNRLLDRSKLDLVPVAERAFSLAAAFTRSIVEQAASPSRFVLNELVAQLAATNGEKRSERGLVGPALTGQTLIATLSERAYERKVRHFLIHEWPGPGMLATSGANGASPAIAASQMKFITPAAASGADGDQIRLVSVSEPGVLTDSDGGVPPGSVSPGIDECGLAGFSDPDCPDGPEIVGRLTDTPALPTDISPLFVSYSPSPAPIGVLGLALGTGLTASSIWSGFGSGSTPASSGGSVGGATGSGGGGSGFGSGGGSGSTGGGSGFGSDGGSGSTGGGSGFGSGGGSGSTGGGSGFGSDGGSGSTGGGSGFGSDGGSGSTGDGSGSGTGSGNGGSAGAGGGTGGGGTSGDGSGGDGSGGSGVGDGGSFLDDLDGTQTDISIFPPTDTGGNGNTNPNGNPFGNSDDTTILTGPSAVPVPAPLALMLTGLAGFAYLRRKKTRTQRG